MDQKTIDSMHAIAQKLWDKEKPNSLLLAESVAKANQLPPAAPVLVAGLDKLLAELQKAAFLHGAVATMALTDETLSKYIEITAAPHPEPARRPESNS